MTCTRGCAQCDFSDDRTSIAGAGRNPVCSGLRAGAALGRTKPGGARWALERTVGRKTEHDALERTERIRMRCFPAGGRTQWCTPALRGVAFRAKSPKFCGVARHGAQLSPLPWRRSAARGGASGGRRGGGSELLQLADGALHELRHRRAWHLIWGREARPENTPFPRGVPSSRHQCNEGSWLLLTPWRINIGSVWGGLVWRQL